MQQTALLDLPALEKEISIKRRAIAMQREIVARARLEWSSIVCDQLRPVHRHQVQRIWAALQELSAALTEHQEFVYQLRDAEVANFSATLRPMFFVKDSMQLSDPSSSASSWKKDAEDFGLL